jgi:hypothetical protein
VLDNPASNLTAPRGGRLNATTLAMNSAPMTMKSTQDLSASGGMSLRRAENLLLVAWGNAGWPELKELEGRVSMFRADYPAGSAILNVIAERSDERFRRVWERFATMFLAASQKDPGAVPTHLGTVHLFPSPGLKATAARALFRGMERYGRDFARQGNVVFKTMDQATDWLSQRLQAGPVQWTRTELMDLIAPFVHSRASSQKRSADRRSRSLIPSC